MLSALLLAAALQVVPASPPSAAASVERTRPWVDPYHRCDRSKVVRARDAEARPKLQRGSAGVPKGQYAVIRMVDGCGVSTPMR